jgi:hypothetical protein
MESEVTGPSPSGPNAHMYPTYDGVSHIGGDPGTCRVDYTWHIDYLSPPTPTSEARFADFALTRQVNPDGCPPPTECSQNPADGVGDKFVTIVAPSGGGDYCNTVSHCKMSVVSSTSIGGATIYKVTHTSEECGSDSPPEVSNDDVDHNEACAGSTGTTFCLATQGENCGYLNDSFVCLPRVENDGCKVFGDGGRVCGSGAPTPPVPDNGTAGHPATPVATIESTVGGTTKDLEVYSPTQAATSSRDPGTSGDNPYDGKDDGSGDGSGDSESECPDGETCDGDSSASGGETCEAAPSCDGDAIECALLDQEWRNRCVQSPTDGELGDAFGEVAGDGSSDQPMIPTSAPTLGEIDDSGFVGSRCPSDVVIHLAGGLPNVTMPLSQWCAWFAGLGSFVLVGAWLTAARIVMGGV